VHSDVAATSAAATSAAPTNRIWVGGYTPEMDGSAAGIALLWVGARGELSYRGTAASTLSPSFLGMSNGVIYATGESGPTVAAFARDGDDLTPLGEHAAAGEFPCALAAVDSLLIVASYGDGAVGVHRLEESGAIRGGAPEQVLRSAGRGPHKAQDGPHAHAALAVPRNDQPTLVLTTDLGTDSIFVHTVHPERLASPLSRIGAIHLAPGTGPRDLLLRPSGDVWVLGELSCELVILRPEGDSYRVAATVPLAGALAGDHASAIALNSAGTHAYIGLRGSNLISIVEVDVAGDVTATSSTSCGGDWPRHLTVVGEHLYVANQRSSSVESFAIEHDGMLTLAGSVAVASPTYLLVD
jgi:6-phosphogluconolactonase